MKTFFLGLVSGAILIYAVVLICGMIAGDAGIWIAALLVLGAVFALLACVLEKLDRMEGKLDKLLRERQAEEETRP